MSNDLRYPFLRWIGGKQRSATHLLPLVPELPSQAVYWEPFVGAASLFLRLRPKQAVLADRNLTLIELYRDIQCRPDLVSRYLREWRGPMNQERYLRARHVFNSVRAGPRRSALFVLLNRTCFNGIWRVNRAGDFNVPFGRITTPILPSPDEINGLSAALAGVRLLDGDFEVTVRRARAPDFIYLDPPYRPTNGTAFFTHYTRQRFGDDDQERLAGSFRSLTQKGCRVMLSTSGSRWIRNLYREFRIRDLPTTRYVAAGGIRRRVTDVVITNYDLTR